jgi:hypothetical protein
MREHEQEPRREPTVSVIVNNYNYARFLGEAIDSALAQTHPYTEVVVVDDGSTDDSREIIAGYEGRIVPVLKENGGQASAFNAGFAASSGDIVIFLDADDYLFPDAVERVAAAWEPGVACVQYRLEMVDAHGIGIGFYPPRESVMETGEVWRILLEKGYYNSVPTSGLSFDRKVLEQVFPMPDTGLPTAADSYLITAVPFHGRVKSLERPLGAYRIHGGNWRAHKGVPSAKKLRSRVQTDLFKQEVIARKAAEMGREVPCDLGMRSYGNLQDRIVLLRLAPEEHLMPSDRRSILVYHGLRAVCRYSKLPWRRKLRLSAWFVWAGLLPLPVAKLAFDWKFNPRSRPAFVNLLHRSA